MPEIKLTKDQLSRIVSCLADSCKELERLTSKNEKWPELMDKHDKRSIDFLPRHIDKLHKAIETGFMVV